MPRPLSKWPLQRLNRASLSMVLFAVQCTPAHLLARAQPSHAFALAGPVDPGYFNLHATCGCELYQCAVTYIATDSSHRSLPDLLVACRYPKCEQPVEDIKDILNKARTPSGAPAS